MPWPVTFARTLLTDGDTHRVRFRWRLVRVVPHQRSGAMGGVDRNPRFV
jgi:hypothetical protein